MLAAGAAFVARELFQMRPAAAAYGIKNAGDGAQCEVEGGTVSYFRQPEGDVIGHCDTAEDLACVKRYNDSEAYYSAEYGECRFYDDLDEMNDPQKCFLTTACVDQAGLSDDCFELETLRRFRDNVLAKMSGGAADIATYYREAPALVAAIRRHPAGAAELSRAYLLYILPSAVLARLGFNRLAYRTYRRMMQDLPLRLAA